MCARMCLSVCANKSDKVLALVDTVIGEYDVYSLNFFLFLILNSRL